MSMRTVVKKAWRKIDRHVVHELTGISIRCLDQYANGLQFPSAKRSVQIARAAGVHPAVIRPDIFADLT